MRHLMTLHEVDRIDGRTAVPVGGLLNTEARMPPSEEQCDDSRSGHEGTNLTRKLDTVRSCWLLPVMNRSSKSRSGDNRQCCPVGLHRH
jgi:hypothetical protein